jgi:hypothetical protein
MKRTINRCTIIGTVLTGILTGSAALAGWSGAMNGVGFGQAQVNVTSSTSHSNTVATTNMVNPSAAMTTTAGYVFGGPLPSGSSAKTVARILGKPGYVWKATTTAKNGDKTDNNSLSNLVVASSQSASTTVEVLLFTVNTDSASTGCPDGSAQYTFVWHWSGTDAGTAQRVQWYELDGDLPPDFNGDFGGLSNAVLLDTVYGTAYSPCDANYNVASDCRGCTCDTNFDELVTWTVCGPADSSKLYMVTDGIAVSQPCTMQFSGFLPPIGAADVTGGSCSAPIGTFKSCSTIPIKMILTCGGDPVTTGKHTISFTKCSTQVSTTSVAVDDTPKKEPATSGKLFQLADPTTGQWKFNLDTRRTGLSRGRWKITATLSDGTTHFVYIEIK